MWLQIEQFRFFNYSFSFCVLIELPMEQIICTDRSCRSNFFLFDLHTFESDWMEWTSKSVHLSINIFTDTCNVIIILSQLLYSAFVYVGSFDDHHQQDGEDEYSTTPAFQQTANVLMVRCVDASIRHNMGENYIAIYRMDNHHLSLSTTMCRYETKTTKTKTTDLFMDPIAMCVLMWSLNVWSGTVRDTIPSTTFATVDASNGNIQKACLSPLSFPPPLPSLPLLPFQMLSLSLGYLYGLHSQIHVKPLWKLNCPITMFIEIRRRLTTTMR